MCPIRLDVYVQPRASKTEVSGEHDGAIKIRLAAPPVDDAANAALAEFIAHRLGVPKTSVRIVSGARSRRKVVEIANAMDLSEARRALFQRFASKSRICSSNTS